MELGQLALQKGTSPQVKQFAQRMVTDHTQANQELMQLAKTQNLDLPTQVDAKHKHPSYQIAIAGGAGHVAPSTSGFRC